MRNEEEVLARARVLNLVEALAGGVSLELLRPELRRHGLGVHLTEREARWFSEEEAVDASDPRPAIVALAWVLGLAPSLDAIDIEAIRDALDALAPTGIAMRDEATIRAQREELAPGPMSAALDWALSSS